MHEYQLSSTPSFPGESGQVQHLLGCFTAAEKQFDSQENVLVAKLSTLQTNSDGSVITRNADGLITTILMPIGTVVHLAYDKHGTVIQFNDALNFIYKLENDCFQQYDSNGINATGLSLDENEADVDYEGNLTIYHPNGSHIIAKTDGSVIEVNSANKILKVSYSDGRVFAIEYDTTGEVVAIVDPLAGTTLTLDDQTGVYIDALGVITLIKDGMGYVWRTDGECLIFDLDKCA
jgi:hypothetical protein